ncbi:MAG: LamB/YcsF family protein [Alcanivoracaceae bacterium]|nr:LamB/YcsF family protein [Alcanivoracaceae bacterium]
MCLQIKDFIKACEELNVEMHHIKLHGALYNLAANDPEIAAIVLNVFAAVKADIKIYVPYQSVIAMLADDYFPIAYEAFIDRRYHSDLSLVSRSNDNAVITDLDQAWQQMSSIVNQGQLKSVEGDLVSIKADTFCLHGDEKNAVALIQHIRQCLCH